MKKLYSLFLAALLVAVSVPAFAIDDPTFANYIKKRAEGAKFADASRGVRLVRFSNNGLNASSLVSGDAVVWDTVSDDGVSVRTTTTSADGAFAGIVCTTIPTSDASTGTSAYDDLGRRNWGWIVVEGFMTARATAGGTNGNSAGDIFITSTDSGVITTLENAGGNSTANQIQRAVRGRGGFFFDAGDGSSTTYEVYVQRQ